ncbi:MAG: hypothetical protein AUJ52_04445 [Elusimicrobia bacterium CG1_02_63_36]|nr:MAG: hypothetical protein AUJ52_04445 [Elusimicrobia bacterium CG1_02_63_36]
MAASFAALSGGGCVFRPPEGKVVPLMEQPAGVFPGETLWYATTCGACTASCGALVKVRDGRPIKLEGNPEHPLSRGGLCARGQASVLDLYDSHRLRFPLLDGKEASWAALDAFVSERLNGVAVLSETIVSPTLRFAVERFLKKFPGSRLVEYDSLSASAILDAHARTHGVRTLPAYHLGKARVIVSFDADFLGSWISPVEFTKDWSPNRQPEREWDTMSWHAQFESRLSVTGANADLRVPLRPSEQYETLRQIGLAVASLVFWKGPKPPAGEPSSLNAAAVSDTAGQLARAAGRSLVLSGSPDAATQCLVNWINAMLGNYGETLVLDPAGLQKRGSETEFDRLLGDLEKGAVKGVVVLSGNPVYDHPKGAELAKFLDSAKLSLSLSGRPDETAVRCRAVAPDHHPLESWSDAEAVSGVLSLSQPAIAPLYSTRAAIESLSLWAGEPMSALDALRGRWKKSVLPGADFERRWHEALRKGVVLSDVKNPKNLRFDGRVLERLSPNRLRSAEGGFELSAYASPVLGDGRQANNPWLQETPDPISKTAWGNYASFSPEDAAKLGIVEGRVVRLSAGAASIELPAQIQKGHARGVVSAALGYGRTHAGPVAANFPVQKMLPVEREELSGADLFPLTAYSSVRVESTGRMSAPAKTQTYDEMSDPITGRRRPMVQETTLQDYFKDATSGRGKAMEVGPSLWPAHDYPGPKWAMAIDLNVCTGCSSCVVACGLENNVPVVGKAEVRKSRDMHWMRIDRYYNENGETAFQPMLCQHCDNAPCETVCPVLATLHSSEGMNMQVYNRCVGTRYCANNCPYKVRRFNWFDYAHEDLTQNLALNPDITVRTRGVMEKCSFCVQRVQSAKADARAENRAVTDGEVRPACAQSCPADAIVFGDLNDPKSAVAKKLGDPRSYAVLSELGVGPSVFYMTKVRNKKV